MVAGISSCLALHKQTIPHIPSLFGGSSPSISLDYSVSLYCSSLIGSEEVITLSFIQVFSLIDGSMALFLFYFIFACFPHSTIKQNIRVFSFLTLCILQSSMHVGGMKWRKGIFLKNKIFLKNTIKKKTLFWMFEKSHNLNIERNVLEAIYLRFQILWTMPSFVTIKFSLLIFPLEDFF